MLQAKLERHHNATAAVVSRRDLVSEEAEIEIEISLSLFEVKGHSRIDMFDVYLETP